MKPWMYRWGPPILLMAIIFFASATPGSDIPKFGYWDMLVKKGGHMLGYALLAIALYHALNNGRRSTKLLFVLALGIVALYAGSDEFHQRFTPGRTASLRDVGIDVTGALIGITTLRLVQKRTPIPKEGIGDGSQ
jgi:VanZ family protein